MRVPFARPIIEDEEIAAVTTVLKASRTLTNGGRVAEFERGFSDYIGGGQCLAVSSCTAALHMACMALDIGPGDEVIVPALTFAASAHAVEAVGATPVFVDSYPTSGVMDPDQVEALITPSTKAIMVVHYAGRPAYMGSILALARTRGIAVIEDCATSLGAYHSRRHVGLLGDIGCFSFHPVKHLTTGEGGMFVTRRPELYERGKLLREFGKDASVYNNARSDRSCLGHYDIKTFGLNYRMTEMQGAIGVAALAKMEKRLKIRKQNYAHLRHHLSAFTPLDLGGDEAAAYCFVAILPDGADQAEFRLGMARRYVETTVYYPGPLPFLGYYAEKYGYKRGEFPAAEKISSRGIALPCGPHLGGTHMEYIVKAFKETVDENCASGRSGVYWTPSGPEASATA
jgi:perosamine synthetase